MRWARSPSTCACAVRCSLCTESLGGGRSTDPACSLRRRRPVCRIPSTAYYFGVEQIRDCLHRDPTHGKAPAKPSMGRPAETPVVQATTPLHRLAASAFEVHRLLCSLLAPSPDSISPSIFREGRGVARTPFFGSAVPVRRYEKPQTYKPGLRYHCFAHGEMPKRGASSTELSVDPPRLAAVSVLPTPDSTELQALTAQAIVRA